MVTEKDGTDWRVARNICMQVSRCMLLLISAALCAQAQSAVVNGKSVSLSDVQRLMGAMPPELRGNPEEIYRYYGFIDRLAAKAESDKLAEQSPYKEQLELQRKQLLAQAEMDQFYQHQDISDDELKKYYEEHKDNFVTAGGEYLLIPVKSRDEAAAAMTKARGVATQLKTGRGIEALLAQYPANLPAMRKSDPRIPQAVRTAAFALKPGEVSAPVVESNGVYVLRLQKIFTPDLQDIRGEVWQTIAATRFAAWMEEIRKTVTVTTGASR
jgi:foldase protein PrsA